MRFFKRLDLGLQLLLVISGIILGLMNGAEGMLLGYLLVGGCQLASLLIHSTLPGKYYPVKARRHYALTVVFVGITGVFAFPVFLYYLIALLIGSPFLALWYCIICVREIRLLDEKFLVHLKR